MKQKGFTLIELLVVVAIMGILAGVGVVAFNGFIQKSKEVRCASDHNTVVKFIRFGIANCAINNPFNLNLSSGGLNLTPTNRCGLVGSGDGENLKNRIHHHFANEVLFGRWCSIDGRVRGDGHCQEMVANGGTLGTGPICEIQLHSCDNAAISSCNSIVVETRVDDNNFLKDEIAW